jgi:transaldolase
MRIWLNSVDIELIQTGVAMGAVHGVMLRPKDISENKKSLENLLDELVREEEGPIAIPLALDEPEEMTRQAQELFHFSNRLIAAIPACKQGYEAMSRLNRLGIPTLATCILSVKQGIFSLQAGARFIDVWLSEMVDTGIDGWKEIIDLRTILNHENQEAELVVSSIRNEGEFLKCAELGIDGVTLSKTLFLSLIEDSSKSIKFQEEFKTHLLPV